MNTKDNFKLAKKEFERVFREASDTIALAQKELEKLIEENKKAKK